MSISASYNDDLAVITVRGDFTYDSTAAFREAASDVTNRVGVKRIEVDFADATYIDSSALGLLLSLRDGVRGKGQPIELTNVRGNVRQVLEIASFGTLFTIRR
jgi:HptB-dependent secretion and biofilm anti anti-sigma factor